MTFYLLKPRGNFTFTFTCITENYKFNKDRSLMWTCRNNMKAIYMNTHPDTTVYNTPCGEAFFSVPLCRQV